MGNVVQLEFHRTVAPNFRLEGVSRGHLDQRSSNQFSLGQVAQGCAQLTLEHLQRQKIAFVTSTSGFSVFLRGTEGVKMKVASIL